MSNNKKNEENNVVKFDDVVEEMVQESAEKNGLKVEEKKEGLVTKVKNNKKKILIGAGIMVGVGLVAYGIYKIVTSDGNVVEVPQADYEPETEIDVPFVEETTGV